MDDTIEMDERVRRASEVLEDAKRAHVAISARTGGADPEWALFYAWWLRDWSGLPDLLGVRPSLSLLVHELVRVDRAYRAAPGGRTWSESYAEQLLAVDWGA